METVSIKNLGKNTYHFNGMNLLPSTTLMKYPKADWELMLTKSKSVKAAVENHYLVATDDSSVEVEVDSSVEVPVVEQSKSVVGDDRVKLTIGVEGEGERDISTTKAPSPDWDLVQEMTKAQIEDYADQFNVQLNLEDTKAAMIDKFKSETGAHSS